MTAPAAGLDDDEIALSERQGLLAFHRTLGGRARVQRDAVGGRVLAAGEAIGCDDTPLEHGGERHLAGGHAIRPPESEPTAMRAVTARAWDEGLLLHAHRVLALDHLDGRVHDIGHVDTHARHAVLRRGGALATP